MIRQLSSPKTLDRKFKSLARLHLRQTRVAAPPNSSRYLRLALEREDEKIAVFEACIGDPGSASTFLLAERLTKFFLWSRGGWRLYVSAAEPVYRHLAATYQKGGQRGFDVGLMEGVYGKSFEVISAEQIDLPGEKSAEAAMGGHQGDQAALAIYETIGSYLGHTLPLYATFYQVDHVLLLGRVTTGPGGNIILQQAQAVLRRHEPALADQLQLHLPDEKSRRVGQAVASLPRIEAGV